MRFLTAEWRHLVMLNWRVPAELLEPHVPVGTTLDAWEQNCYLSLVGFLFQETRVLGIPIPFHRNFEEVNLRFYVRRVVNGEVRRGVVFLRELVPRRAIAWTARLAYNEPYRAVSMAHSAGNVLEYAWRDRGSWTRVAASATGEWKALVAGSHEEFITEHYWGYTRQRDGGTIEYRVVHPRWLVQPLRDVVISGDVAATYGDAFARIMTRAPDSALLADGSPIEVHLPTRLPSI